MASPKIPSIVKRALLYKAQLNSHLEKVTNDMADQWVKISAGLSKNIDDLIAEMQIRNVMDMPFAERARWMAEMDRYQDLLAQSEAMAKSYGAWSADYITNAQIQSIQLGINEFSSVTQGYFVGMPSPQIEMLHGALTGKSPLLRLFNQIGSKDAMENALLMGLTLGKPLSEIGKDLAAAANISLARGTLIARTEVIRAHNTTSLDLYQMYGIEKYRRLVSRGHACIACLMLDGEILASRDALYDHPNGACTTVPIVDPDNPPEWETGKEYFEKLPEAEQRQRMGTNFYDAWKRGDFTLQDLVSIRHDPIWGDSPQITPLKTLSPNWKSYRQISGNQAGSQGMSDESLLDYLKKHEQKVGQMSASELFMQSMNEVKQTGKLGTLMTSQEIESWLKVADIWYGEGKDGTTHPFGAALQSQISAGSLPTNNILYRGDNLRKYNAVKQNDVITFDQFTSTTVSRPVAEVFAGKYSANQQQLIFVLQAPAGTKGAYVHDVAAEFLLPAQTRVKVLERVGNTIYGVILP